MPSYFDNQIRRNFRQGTAIGDRFLLLSLFSGLLILFGIKKSISKYDDYRPLTSTEQAKIREIECQMAKPFNFRKAISIQSLLSLLAISAPMVGMFLYLYKDWWMFFCILIFGVIEILLAAPFYMLKDFIKTDWKFDANTKIDSIRQLRFLLYQSIVSNILLAILNSYPLVVPYQENCWVILMLIFLWLFNISSICNAIYTLKHLNTLVEENINRFN